MVLETLSVFSKQLSGKDYSGLDVLAVVLTGISVVFAGLVILILLVMLYGKIFDTINQKKAKNAEAAKNAELAEKALKAPPVQKAMPDLPKIESGIEEETVAVIMAAIEAYGAQSGKKLVLKGIKRASKGNDAGVGNVWAQAARSELTRPF